MSFRGFFHRAELFGQRILYNDGLDKKGHRSAVAAKRHRVSRYGKRTPELKAIESEEIDVELQAGNMTMRTQIQQFERGGSESARARTLRQLYADDAVKGLAWPVRVCQQEKNCMLGSPARGERLRFYKCIATFSHIHSGAEARRSGSQRCDLLKQSPRLATASQVRRGKTRPQTEVLPRMGKCGSGSHRRYKETDRTLCEYQGEPVAAGKTER